MSRDTKNEQSPAVNWRSPLGLASANAVEVEGDRCRFSRCCSVAWGRSPSSGEG